MADTKRFSNRSDAEGIPRSASGATRGNQAQHEVLQVEGARQPAQPAKRGLKTGSLAIEREENHNPYMRIPEAERRRAQGQRTDLRKLSAWIKMMRALEEAKKRDDQG
jgi:hypothetical protein